MNTHSKGLTDANWQGPRPETWNVTTLFASDFLVIFASSGAKQSRLNEMAGDSVAINPGNAGEHPGASRVAGLPACIFSEVFACGWYRPCKPLGKKTRPLFALSLRGESGESGKAVFGTAVR